MMSVQHDRREQAQIIFQKDLQQVLHRLQEMLIEKNRKYGDAALNPKQTFSRAPVTELIKVRIDDKLSRIENRQTDEDEDPAWDLLGYLVLLQIAEDREKSAKYAQAPSIPMPKPPHQVL
jgi:hypothetical protein